MKLELERAFVDGWVSITKLNIPPKRIIEALMNCRNESEAKYLGKEFAKDYIYDDEDKWEDCKQIPITLAYANGAEP